MSIPSLPWVSSLPCARSSRGFGPSLRPSPCRVARPPGRSVPGCGARSPVGAGRLKCTPELPCKRLRLDPPLRPTHEPIPRSRSPTAFELADLPEDVLGRLDCYILDLGDPTAPHGHGDCRHGG